MKIEKIDRVAVAVKNLDQAEKFFADLLGTTFQRSPTSDIVKTLTEHGQRVLKEKETKYVKVAISPTGLELVETSPPCDQEGIRSFHFKVSNLEEAKTQMKNKGIHLLTEIKHGGLKEAIFDPDDLHGIRLVLVEYDAPTPMTAILQSKK